jgi:hypothetical protein
MRMSESPIGAASRVCACRLDTDYRVGVEVWFCLPSLRFDAFAVEDRTPI